MQANIQTAKRDFLHCLGAHTAISDRNMQAFVQFLVGLVSIAYCPEAHIIIVHTILYHFHIIHKTRWVKHGGPFKVKS